MGTFCTKHIAMARFCNQWNEGAKLCNQWNEIPPDWNDYVPLARVRNVNFTITF